MASSTPTEAKFCWPAIKEIGHDVAEVGKQTYAIYNNRIYTLVRDCPWQALVIEIGMIFTASIFWSVLGPFSLIPAIGLARQLAFCACFILPIAYYQNMRNADDKEILNKQWKAEIEIVQAQFKRISGFLFPESPNGDNKSIGSKVKSGLGRFFSFGGGDKA